MKNQVIKVLNEEHGKKVIEYWKSRGIDSISHKGTSCQENNDDHIYYGVINGIFENYSYGYVKLNNAEIIELPEEKTFPRRMLVSNNDEKYYERIVLAKLPGRTCSPYVIVHEKYEHKFNAGELYYIEVCKYAKELPQVEEMTLEQICKELGREIKIIK